MTLTIAELSGLGRTLFEYSSEKGTGGASVNIIRATRGRYYGYVTDEQGSTYRVDPRVLDRFNRARGNQQQAPRYTNPQEGWIRGGQRYESPIMTEYRAARAARKIPYGMSQGQYQARAREAQRKEARDQARTDWRTRRDSRQEEARERRAKANPATYKVRDRIRARMENDRADREQNARQRREGEERARSDRRSRAERQSKMTRQQRREDYRTRSDARKAANKAKVKSVLRKMKRLSDKQLESVLKNPNVPGWQKRLAQKALSLRAYAVKKTKRPRRRPARSRPKPKPAWASSAGTTSMAMVGGGRQVTTRPVTGGGSSYGGGSGDWKLDLQRRTRINQRGGYAGPLALTDLQARTRINQRGGGSSGGSYAPTDLPLMLMGGLGGSEASILNSLGGG